MQIKPIRTMMNHQSTELFFTDLEMPAENLIGEEGMGFRYIIDGWNAERILIAAESIGDGRWFVERAVKYAKERVVFGKPIGANQGVQFPIALAHAHLEAANLMRFQAACLFERAALGAEANMAKLLGAEAAWEAANACLDTPRRLRVCRGVRCRAQVPGDAPLYGRPGLEQSRARLPRAARARPAAVLLRIPRRRRRGAMG